MTKRKSLYIENWNTVYKNILKIEDGLFPRDIEQGNKEELKRFFDKCQSKHQELRQLLGGVVKKASFKDIYTLTQDDNIVKTTYIYQVCEDIYNNPNYKEYFDKYKIPFSVLLSGKFDNGRPFGKHFLNYMRKKSNNVYEIYNIENNVSALGRLYSYKEKIKNVLQNKEVDIVISTAFNDFVRLGHYEDVDSCSCFNNSGCHNFDKLVLASSYDSFVFLVYIDKKCILRAWGVYDKNQFTFSNFYIAPSLNDCLGFSLESSFAITIVSQITNKTVENLRIKDCEEDYYNIFDNVYCNGDAICIKVL